jgi:hypothetical protein
MAMMGTVSPKDLVDTIRHETGIAPLEDRHTLRDDRSDNDELDQDEDDDDDDDDDEDDAMVDTEDEQDDVAGQLDFIMFGDRDASER